MVRTSSIASKPLKKIPKQRVSSWSARSAVLSSVEEEASEYISKNLTKPVVGFIAGLTAPPGRRMGHAGAIISGSSGTAEAKLAAMKAGGVHVCENLGALGELCVKVFV